MLFAVLGFVLVQALAIQASLLSSSHRGDDIEALCARKSVDLTSLSQLRQLGQAAGVSSSCSSTLKQAISELVTLIDSGKDDLCSVETINALRAYYGKYLDTSGPLVDDDDADDKELLPKSLKRFVLAYGMQMSNLCKKNMVNVLSNEGRQLVEPSDFEQLDALIKDDGPVAQILDTISSPGEVFLPGDLVPFFKRHNIQTNDFVGDKLVMQTATSDYIRKFQAVCQHRFKPVYEPLMMPLVRLVNMGFDYKDEPLRCDLKCPKIVHDVGQWSRVVFLCETLANVRIVEDKQNQVQSEGSGSSSSLVRILTKEEADAIEGGASAQHDDDEFAASIGDVVYTPHAKVALTADEIYDKSDKQLHKAIRSFKTSHGEEYILRKRVTKKGLALIKKQLKSGHFGFIFSAAWKGMMNRGKAVNSPAKEFVESLNEIVEQQANGGANDGAVSSAGVPAALATAIAAAIIIVIFVSVAVGVCFAAGAFGR